ncbi:hypothetical protein PINS_up005741 [Pythium insidiosum]|nr:hypothetical protein PINS_up005741 [Pythium insidiosum]
MDGVVSAELKDVAANDKCPTQQKNMVFSGAEIRKVSGVSNWQCCDECGKTAGCAAYSWVAATSECSLKWFAGSATAKDGVVSAELKDVAANDKCPTQQKNMVFSGAGDPQGERRVELAVLRRVRQDGRVCGVLVGGGDERVQPQVVCWQRDGQGRRGVGGAEGCGGQR